MADHDAARIADHYAHPRPGDLCSPWRFLLWLIAGQKWRVLRASLVGSVWMVGLAAPPYLLSQAIDEGLGPGNTGALVGWALALVAVCVTNAAVGGFRHGTMTKIRTYSAYQIGLSTVRHSTRLGAALGRKSSSGEVVAIGLGDVQDIATALTVTGPGVGSVVAYVVVAVLLFAISPLLAVVVSAGVPVLAVTIGPVLHRTHGAMTPYREQSRVLVNRLIDIVTGLRVLGGLGGKQTYLGRYREDSQALVRQGYRVGAASSWTGALGSGVPTLFLAAVTWIAARMAAEGSITVGQLIAVYGYVAMLVVPVSSFIEGAQQLTAATVAARRVIRFLALEPDHSEGVRELVPRQATFAPSRRPARTLAAPAESPSTSSTRTSGRHAESTHRTPLLDGQRLPDAAPGPDPGVLHDPVSGAEIPPGVFVALVGAEPADCAGVLERLARFTASDATWGGVRLDEVALPQIRSRILLAENDAALFAGTARETVAGRREAQAPALGQAVWAAVASDIVDALSDGLDSTLDSGARNLSGGQRQRLRLARALYAQPEVLLMTEPTSAVDAHTEAAIAARLREARRGLTTVVTTSSPLVLDKADLVLHLIGGRVAATGTHHELWLSDPAYRATVSRSTATQDQEAAPVNPRIPVADAAQVRAALRQDVRSDSRAFAAMLALNAVAALAALVGPAYLGRIVDAVTGAHPSVAAVDRDALVIVVFALAQILLSRWALLVGARFGERTSARIRERMLERALALPASVVEHATTGDLVSRGTSDAGMVATTLRDAAPIIFVSAVQVLCIVGAVLVLNPLLGMCAVACLAGDVFVLRWYLRRSRPAFLAQSSAGAAITDVLESTASGARTVEALGLEQRRIEAAETAYAASIKAQLRSLRLRLVLFPTVDASYVLPLAGILLIGGALYEHREIALGVVVAATVYVRQLVGPLDTILLWVQTLQNAAVSYARVEGLAAAPQAGPPTRELPQGDRIEVTDVRFAYNADHGDVLHGVNLVVQPGERLAIVGASGAGKSTLGRLLAGIDRPSHGSVTVGGVPIADLPPERLRRQVVLVTQEHHVFNDTLHGNLTPATAGATADEVLAALAAVDAGWVDALPEGLNTTVAGNGHRLDGAQAQQLALARVVLADPHTVILDEATALLDPATARNTERALAAVLEGRTVIAIAHRLQTAHDADRVAVMDAGSVTELGTHEELVALGGTYAALWRSWHGG